MKIFILSWSGWEESTQYILLGPDSYSEEDFVKLTESLFDEAALIAINNEVKEKYFSYVGWHSIAREIVPLLKKYGFDLAITSKSKINGSMIISDLNDLGDACHKLSADTAKALITYNKSISKL